MAKRRFCADMIVPHRSQATVLLFFFTSLLFTCVRAQDARFNQLHATPLLTNPALTGVMNANLRLTLNYRTSYNTVADSEGFRSMAVASEFRRPVGRQNSVGLGVQLQHDRAATHNYVRSQAVVSASYQQAVGQGSFLALGVQGGVGQRGFDGNKLWYSNQYFVDGGSRRAYLDRRLSNGEPFTNLGTQLYADVNIGLVYFASYGDRQGLYAGGSAYHLSRPNLSPLPGGEDLLDQRYVVHAGGELPLGSGDMSLLPSGRVMQQGPSLSGLLGAAMRYTQRRLGEVALRAGLWTHLIRDRDEGLALGSLIALVSLEYEQYHVTVSYDLAVGPLQVSTGTRGGFELGVVYLHEGPGRMRVDCPNF